MLNSYLPWSEYKESGIGKDGEFEGLKALTQLRIV
jgi:hypothetical protein